MPVADPQGPDESGTVIIPLSGVVDLPTVMQVGSRLASARDQRGTRQVVIALDGAAQIRPAAAAVLRKWGSHPANIPVELRGTEHHTVAFALAPEPEQQAPEERLAPSVSARVGDKVVGGFDRLGGFAVDSVRIARVAGRSIPRRTTAPVGHLCNQISRMSADALPIVVLLGALIGVSFALQSSSELKAYGAEGVLPALLGLGVIRYLGPIIAAVVVIGRSGAAVTSELGIMNIREETAALKMMGIDPWQYLGLPRFIGFLITLPVLSVFTSTAAVLAGLGVARLTGGMPMALSIDQMFQAITAGEIIQAMLKTLVFGAAIGLTALSYGFSVTGGAREVGGATTRAVVQMILLLILIDFAFALVAGLAL